MGKYLSVDELTGLYGEEVRRFFPTSNQMIDRPRLEKAISRTEDFVDAFLHRFCQHQKGQCERTWPRALVARAVAAILRRDWHIHGAPEPVEHAAEQAIIWLKQISTPASQKRAVRHAGPRPDSSTLGY